MISRSTLRRIEHISAMCSEMERKIALAAPLMSLLTPKRYAYYKAGFSFATGEMSIHLPAHEWSQQYEAGIDQCLGFHIEYWV